MDNPLIKEGEMETRGREEDRLNDNERERECLERKRLSVYEGE